MPGPPMPDLGVVSFWRRCARGCHLGSLSAHLPSGSVAEARGRGWPLWLLTRDWGVVRTGQSREIPLKDHGFVSSDPCFLSQISESRARTHRAPAQALIRSDSSRYSPPALPWAPPPSDLNHMHRKAKYGTLSSVKVLIQCFKESSVFFRVFAATAGWSVVTSDEMSHRGTVKSA